MTPGEAVFYLRAAVTNRDQQRLDLLVRAGEIFHQSLDVKATLDNVARLAVESFADLCLFDLIDERSARLFVTASAHRDRSKEEALATVSGILYVEDFGLHPVVQVTRSGKPFFLPHIDDAVIAEHAASRQHESYMRRFDYRSKIVVPVIAQDRIFGALTFVRSGEGAVEFDESDLNFALDLGRRAGLAVANAKQFHREQYVAETLQRAFLTGHFPSREGLAISAHYRPGSTEADIGGDWYDAFEDDAGNIVITIGDVTGKGIEAARLMVLMRQTIRVAALYSSDPVRIADACNVLLLKEVGDRLASAFIGIYDPGARELRYVSAGHAPPVLRLPSKHLLRLNAPSAPLGAFRDVAMDAHVIACPENSLLVLYTDGIIEASRDVIAGELMLDRVLASDAVLHVKNAAEFIERAVAGSSPRDDIAILALNFSRPRSCWRFEADDARAVYAERESFFEDLRRIADLDADGFSTCGVIFSELIANAVRHAPGAVSVSLELSGDDVILHVIDNGPGFDYHPSLPQNIWAESGRGLFLVSQLATRVEVERLPGLGSHIAATLPVRPVLATV